MQEKQNELTDINVALCSAGTIWFKAMSDRIWIRSSAKAVTNPPKVIRYHTPVNSLRRPAKASEMQTMKSFPNDVLLAFLAARAPKIPPKDMMKSRGPKVQSGIPVIGSFACRKNRSKTSIPPTSAFLKIRPATFLLPLRKFQLPL